jgi:hypothetical protein
MPFTPVATFRPCEAQSCCPGPLRRIWHRLSLPAPGESRAEYSARHQYVPTGGGKTIAFWYALFYHWQPGNVDDEAQKIVLVVGPLVALLQSQARTLNAKGIPAVAIVGGSKDLEKTLIVSENKPLVRLILLLTLCPSGSRGKQISCRVCGARNGTQHAVPPTRLEPSLIHQKHHLPCNRRGSLYMRVGYRRFPA